MTSARGPPGLDGDVGEVRDKFNVAIESHPETAVRFADWEPAALNVKPFQVYGNWEEQIAMFVVDVMAGRMTTWIVCGDPGHPFELVSVTVN